MIADPRWGLALDESASDLVRQVIWPYGYSVIEDAGRRVLRDESGQIVAGAQDDVTIAGGEYGQSDAWLACGEPPVLAKP